MQPRKKMDAETRHMRDSIIRTLISFRENAGVSQSEMAERMGVPQPRVSEFESLGERRVYLDTCIEYARVLGVEIRLVGALPRRKNAGPARGRPSRHRASVSTENGDG